MMARLIYIWKYKADYTRRLHFDEETLVSEAIQVSQTEKKIRRDSLPFIKMIWEHSMQKQSVHCDLEEG